MSLDLRVGEVLEAAADGYVSVKVRGGTLSLPVLRDYTPTVGDVCLVLMRDGQGYVLGALGTAPPAPEVLDPETTDAPAPVEEPESGELVFMPVFVGTWRDGGWRDTRDLYQGDAASSGLNFGVAYYGGYPASLDDAVPYAAALTVQRLPGGPREAAAPTFRLLGDADPAGDPAGYLDTFEGPPLLVGQLETFELPVSWAVQLVDGTAGGIGIYTDTETPYVRLDGSRMGLRIDWTR